MLLHRDTTSSTLKMALEATRQYFMTLRHRNLIRNLCHSDITSFLQPTSRYHWPSPLYRGRVNKKLGMNALLAPTCNQLKSLLKQIFWHCVIESSPSQRVCKLDRFLELLVPISKVVVTQLGGYGPEGNPI